MSKKHPKWTKETVVAEIQRLAENGVIVSTRREALNANARRVFGSWAAACEAAGVVTKAVARSADRVQCCVVPGCEEHPRSTLSRYCEKHYMRIRRTGHHLTQFDTTVYDRCRYCDTDLTATSQRQFCSARCRARFYRKAPRQKECAVCHKTFIPLRGHATCSKSCRSLFKPLRRKQWVERKRQTDPAWFIMRAQRLDRRKTAKKATASGPINFRKLIGIDEGCCSLCRNPIRFDVRWPHPLSLSVDHVIPLAAGGEHVEANLRIAHLRCNLRKSDKLNGKRVSAERKRQQESMEAKRA